MNNNFSATKLPYKPRKSVLLHSEEISALKKLRSRFRTARDFDETYGFSRSLIDRIIAFGSASEQTVIRIRQILSDEQQ